MDGTHETIAMPSKDYTRIRISPEGGRAAVREDGDIWMIDLTRVTMTKLDPVLADNISPVWTPDGESITFSSSRNGQFNIYIKSADGTGEAVRLLASPNLQTAESWDPSGEQLVYSELNPASGWDMGLATIAPDKDQVSRIVNQTPAPEGAAHVSPDGKWVVYSSAESGEPHIYVKSFPSFEGKYPISVESSTEPVWAPDGSAIYFRSAAKMMKVPIEVATDTEFRAGTPELLWEDDSFHISDIGERTYDIHPDGKRFLMVEVQPKPDSDDADGAENAGRRNIDLVIVENWFEELKRLAP
jgi:Tol biopolymer transport system component